MKVSVNGETVELESTCTLRELLERLHAGKNPCAVELNERIVPRADLGSHMLSDGDSVEIVTLVGGG